MRSGPRTLTDFISTRPRHVSCRASNLPKSIVSSFDDVLRPSSIARPPAPLIVVNNPLKTPTSPTIRSKCSSIPKFWLQQQLCVQLHSPHPHRNSQPVHASQTQEARQTVKISCPRGLFPEEGCLHANIYRKAQETELCTTQGSQGEADERQDHHSVHPRRRSYFAGAQRGIDQRRACAGFAWCSVSSELHPAYLLPPIFIELRYKCVRGAFDLGGVVNRMNARSRYGGTYRFSVLFAITRVLTDFSQLRNQKLKSSSIA